MTVCGRSDCAGRNPCTGADWTLACWSGGRQDRDAEGQLWSDATVNLAESRSAKRVRLLCLEVTTPLLPTSAARLTWELVRGCSSFFPAQKYCPVAFTAGKFQGEGDNSASWKGGGVVKPTLQNLKPPPSKQ